MALPVRRSSDEAVADTSWDAFPSPVDPFQRPLGDLLDSWRQLATPPGAAFRPPADIEESDDAYMVEVELPGVRRDDLDIEVGGRRLTISGERKEKERVGILRRRERTVGRFRYEVVVPGEVDEDGVEAGLADGVLTVRLPKPEAHRPRRIAVR